MQLQEVKAFNVMLTESEAKALKAAVRKCLGNGKSVWTPKWELLYAVMEEKIND